MALLNLANIHIYSAAASAVYVERDERRALEHLKRALHTAWLEQLSAPPDATPLGRSFPVLPARRSSSGSSNIGQSYSFVHLHTACDDTGAFAEDTASGSPGAGRSSIHCNCDSCPSDEWTRLALAFRQLGFAEAAQFCFALALRPTSAPHPPPASSRTSSSALHQHQRQSSSSVQLQLQQPTAAATALADAAAHTNADATATQSALSVAGAVIIAAPLQSSSASIGARVHTDTAGVSRSSDVLQQPPTRVGRVFLFSCVIDAVHVYIVPLFEYCTLYKYCMYI